MELSSEQIDKFKEIHKGLEDFNKYSEDEIREIANGVANYYITLYKIHQRINKEGKEV